MQTEFNNHIFSKGIKDSLDISKLKNDTWAFPTLNVCLLNKTGQGYIVTPLQGNTVNSGTSAVPVIGGVDNVGAVLKIQTDYVIIAAKEFNGIIYILSAYAGNNSLLKGQGEIGVYPAPNVLITNPTVGVIPSLTGFPTSTNTYPFGRFYAPLGNFVPVGTNAIVYEATLTYNIGDFAISPSDNNIYVCVSAITVPEVWNAAHWATITPIAPSTWTGLVFNPASTYVGGTQVLHNGYIWQCSVIITVAAPFNIADWSLVSPLNSSAFNFTFENETEIEIRPDYDGSVNLYLTDYTNPNRAINNGFNIITGELNNRIYNPTSFFSTLNQILGTSKDLSITNVDILAGGYHKYGNYFFYLRYMDASLNVTDTVCVSNACQIFNGDMNNLSTVQGGNGVTATMPYSGKKVVLHLSNIDTSYAYIDVVYMRFYSDVSSQVQLSETYEIANPFPMSSILTTNSITIDGDESVVNVDSGELLTVRGIENTCKTQTQMNNMWWGGNWKGSKTHDDTLIDFAKAIKITYDDITQTRYGGSVIYRRTGNVDMNVSPFTSNAQYKDYKDTYDYVGYFRGEPYAFAVIFELTTGQETEAYFLNGLDNYDDGYLPIDPNYNHFYDPANATYGIPHEANYKGLYRFPSTDHSNPYVDDTATGLRLLGVKFDTTAAITFLGTTASAWMKANVRGMYFVRQERVPTLKYQGLMMPLSKSYFCANDPNNDINFTFGVNGNISEGGNIMLPGQRNHDHYFLTGDAVDTTSVSVVCANAEYSYGQFHGEFAGGGLKKGHESCNFWGADFIWDQKGFFCNNETGVSVNNIISYNDYMFPVYRGYMPMMYVHDTGSLGQGFRYYQSRWFYQYNNYAMYAPDALLEQGNVQVTDGSADYWYKRVAVTDDDTNAGTVKWENQLPTTFNLANTNDLVPIYAMAEVNNGYIYSSKGSIKATSTYNINGSSPIAAHASKYCDSAEDYQGGSSVGSNALSTMTKGSQVWSNRSVRSPRYIGVHGLGDNGNVPMDGFYRLAITNMYNQQPENIAHSGSFTMAALYSSLYSSPFYKISDYIQIFDKNGNLILKPSYTCFKGDCFLQRFYFKQMVWDPTAFNSIGGSVSSWDKLKHKSCNNRYGHGLIMGVVIEMKYNGNMRFKDGTPTYYPFDEAYPWAITPPGNSNGYESWDMNTGNSRTLDEMAYFAYNALVPQPTIIHPTRIRYSAIHDEYSIIDGYRNLMPLAYQDYDSAYQQIMKILEFNDELISVQEDCINKHFTTQSDLTADLTSGDIALGSNVVLSPLIRRIAYYGTQHQYSIIKTKNSIYGVDAYRRLIWNAKMTTTQTGSYVMGGDELNRDKFVEKWVYDWFTETQPITDVISRLPDTPLLGKGIVTGYHSKYKDVMFSFFNYSTGNTAYTIQGIIAFNMMWHNTTSYTHAYGVVYNKANQKWYYCENAIGNIGKQPDLFPNYWTLIDFSTIIPFTGGMNVVVGQVIKCCDGVSDCEAGKLYIVSSNANTVRGCSALASTGNSITINCCTDLSKTIVFNEDVDEFIGETSYNSSTYVNLYNDFFTSGNNILWNQGYLWRHDMPDYLWFYGGQEEMQLSWYENGNSGREDLSSITKSFEAQDIHSSEQEFYWVEWQTEYQDGGHQPFIDDDEFWRCPEYLEHHWKIPIIVKEDADEQDFNTGSSMQGTWLKTTLHYNSNVETFVKNVSTSFRNSSV